VLPLVEWTPDLPSFGGGEPTALNVIPWRGSYKSFPSMSIYSNALNARCQGAYFTRDSAANVYNFAGTATKLYSLATATYNDVSRLAGGAYATAVDDWWEFATWGQTVIATNYQDVPQVITLGGGNFAALGGSPPKARHIAVVKDFVVLGNINDGSAAPNRVRWSAINNSTDWTEAVATQADEQDLQGDGGWVQKVIGGEFGLVFMERQVWRMIYVGSPLVFQFDLVEKGRGAYCPQGTIGYGSMVFFIADDGFYVIVGGGSAQPIGDGKVDKYFLNNLLANSNYLVNAVLDPVSKIVMWAFPDGGAGAYCNNVLIYNWAVGKWALAQFNTETFVRFASPGYTLEGLDAISSSIDALTPSLDSRTWTGGAQSLAAFDTSHKLNTLSGTAMSATVTTGEKQLTPGRRSRVTKTRPLVDGLSASVALRTRNILSESTSTGTAVAQNAFGECPANSDARYHSAVMTTSGAFNFIQGAEVDFNPSAER
jgi:hypothetical protein